jgi:hypothetical protein
MSNLTPSQVSLFDCRSLNAAFGIEGDDFLEITEDDTEYQGFFNRKGTTHTEETKQRISFMTKGCKNPRYGVVLSPEERVKHRRINPPVGANNPRAKTFVLTDPSGKKYKVMGTLKEFCLTHGLSYSTMRAALDNHRLGPRRNGWTIQEKPQ